MMARATLILVLVVSTAHAFVHAYEMSLPSVEQKVAAEFYAGDAGGGASFTGRLSNAWRLMWGIGAIVAGWLVDRFGSRKLLVIYLWGCSITCAMAATASNEQSLAISMMLMGALASIYHPAGLALISHETSPVNRPRALGIHGIFGSAGIGLTPGVIGLLFAAQLDWRRVYGLMVLPGVVLGCVIVIAAWRKRQRPVATAVAKPVVKATTADYRSFAVLTLVAALQGFIYSALMSFLVRYLSATDAPETSAGNYRAAVVLLMGCVGQYVAGRWAKPAHLERQLALVTFGNVPFLLWMAVAPREWQLVAAATLSVVHFMNQPIYNSLIAKYTPSHRRSLCYGISFAMGLGLGSFGAGFAGDVLKMFEVPSDGFPYLYSSLAATAAVGGLICIVLCWLNPINEES